MVIPELVDFLYLTVEYRNDLFFPYFPLSVDQAVSVVPHIPAHKPGFEDEFPHPASCTSSTLYFCKVGHLYPFPIPVEASFDEGPRAHVDLSPRRLPEVV